MHSAFISHNCLHPSALLIQNTHSRFGLFCPCSTRMWHFCSPNYTLPVTRCMPSFSEKSDFQPFPLHFSALSWRPNPFRGMFLRRLCKRRYWEYHAPQQVEILITEKQSVWFCDAFCITTITRVCSYTACSHSCAYIEMASNIFRYRWQRTS